MMFSRPFHFSIACFKDEPVFLFFFMDFVVSVVVLVIFYLFVFNHPGRLLKRRKCVTIVSIVFILFVWGVYLSLSLSQLCCLISV